MEEKSICVGCGKEFTKTNGKQKYCTPECRYKSTNHYETLVGDVLKCAWCGKKFIKTHSKQKYCSAKCKQAFKIKKAGYVPVGSKIICSDCGKEFVKTAGAQRLCSDCSELEKARGFKKICPNCGKEFTANYSKRIYCSVDCRHEHVKKAHSYYINKNTDIINNEKCKKCKYWRNASVGGTICVCHYSLDTHYSRLTPQQHESIRTGNSKEAANSANCTKFEERGKK